MAPGAAAAVKTSLVGQVIYYTYMFIICSYKAFKQNSETPSNAVLISYNNDMFVCTKSEKTLTALAWVYVAHTRYCMICAATSNSTHRFHEVTQRHVPVLLLHQLACA